MKKNMTRELKNNETLIRMISTGFSQNALLPCATEVHPNHFLPTPALVSNSKLVSGWFGGS